MKGKILEGLKNSKEKIVAGITATAVMSSTCIACFAEGESSTVTAMSGALTSVKSDALSALAVVAPIGISIMGAFLVWRYGTKFFKGLAK